MAAATRVSPSAMSSSRNFSSMSKSSRGIRSSSSASSFRLMVSSSFNLNALTFSSVAAFAAATSGISPSSAAATATTSDSVSSVSASASAGFWSLKTGSSGSSRGSSGRGPEACVRPFALAFSAAAYNASSTFTSGNESGALKTITAPSPPAVTSLPPGATTTATAPPLCESCAASSEVTQSLLQIETLPSAFATAMASPAAMSPPPIALPTPPGLLQSGLSVSVEPEVGSAYARTERSDAIPANLPLPPDPAMATRGSSSFTDRTEGASGTVHSFAELPAGAPVAGGVTTAIVAFGPATRSWSSEVQHAATARPKLIGNATRPTTLALLTPVSAFLATSMNQHPSFSSPATATWDPDGDTAKASGADFVSLTRSKSFGWCVTPPGHWYTRVTPPADATAKTSQPCSSEPAEHAACARPPASIVHAHSPVVRSQPRTVPSTPHVAAPSARATAPIAEPEWCVPIFSAAPNDADEDVKSEETFSVLVSSAVSPSLTPSSTLTR